MKQFFKFNLLLLLASFLCVGNALGQTEILLYAEGSAPSLPITKDGITISGVSTGSKNGSSQCSACGLPSSKLYMVSYSSGGLLTIDVGEGNTIESITIIAGLNSSGSTEKQFGHGAFSSDNSTWSEYGDLKAKGYDQCSSITITPQGDYRYYSFGRGKIGGTAPSANAESRIYSVVVTLAGGGTPPVTPGCTATEISGATSVVEGGSITLSKTPNVAGAWSITSGSEYASINASTGELTANASSAGKTIKVAFTPTDEATYCPSTYSVGITQCVGITLSSTSISGVPGNNASWAYSSTVGNPTTYSINWSTGGPADVTNAGLTSSPIEISSASLADGVYTGELTVSNGSCTSAPQTITLEVSSEICAINSKAVDADIADGYDYGDFVMWVQNKDSKTVGSKSNVCSGATARYYANVVTIYLKNYGATAIKLIGQQGSDVNVGSVTIADDLAGAYTAVDGYSAANYKGTDCGEIKVSDLMLSKGKYVQITFADSKEFRVSGVCVTPLFCTPPTITTHPVSATYCPAASAATMTVAATPANGGTLSYQWYEGSTKVGTNSTSYKPTINSTSFTVKCVVTETYGGETCDATSNVANVTVEVPEISGPDRALIGGNIQLTGTHTPAASGAWTSSNTSLATVSSTGLVKGITAGTVTITYKTTTGCTATKELQVVAPQPKITTPTTPLEFTSCAADRVSQTLAITGVELIDVVDITITGTHKAQFAVSPASIQGVSAMNGTDNEIQIVYTGGPSSTLHNANLVLSSSQATSVTIPLQGNTTNCYTLTTTIVDGKGTIAKSPNLTKYPEGSTVTVTATPDGEYNFAGWSGDASGSNATITVTMDANKTVEASFLKEVAPVSCISEDFELLTDAGNCPTSSEESPVTVVRSGSSCSDPYYLALNGGVWKGTNIRMETSSPHSGSVALRVDGSLTLPPAEMPMRLEFYAREGNKSDLPNSTNNYGIVVKQDGVAITSGIYIDDVLMTTTEYGIKVASGNALRPGGEIQLLTTSKWYKVTVELQQKASSVIDITYTTSSRVMVDDVTVYCNPMNLTAEPSAYGLDYILDLGPSAERTFTVAATALPVKSGTVTLSNLGDFEVSFDGGTTWQSGTATFDFSSTSFTKAGKVRMKAGLPIGEYTTDVSLSATGYSKTNPTLTFAGKVTLTMSTLNCDDVIDIQSLKCTDMKKTDLEVKADWTGTSISEGNTGFIIAKAASFTSPSIAVDQYQLHQLTLSAQPTSSGSGRLLQVSIFDGTTLVKSFTSEDLQEKKPYSITVDLSDIVVKSMMKIQLYANGQNIEVWDIKTTATAKKTLQFDPASLEGFISSEGCPSEAKELKIFGKCLDDDSSIDFSSANYEFSIDQTTWGNSIPYSGEFPVAGIKVYARQKASAPAGALYEPIVVKNGTKGETTLYVTGEVSAAAQMTPAAGEVFTAEVVSGKTKRLAIPISDGQLCEDLVVTSTCARISDCDDINTFTNSVTYAKDATNRVIYVEVEEGMNCTINLNAGSGFDRTITVKGSAAPSAGGLNLGSSVAEAPGSVSVSSSGGTDAVTVESTKFDFSVGNPAVGDFSPQTSFTLNNMNGTLYIQPKATTMAGDSEAVVISVGSTTLTLTVTAK
jgi:hypothetical protein